MNNQAWMVLGSVFLAGVGALAKFGMRCYGEQVFNAAERTMNAAERVMDGVTERSQYLRKFTRFSKELDAFLQDLETIYKTTPHMVVEVKQQVRNMANTTANAIQGTASATYETVGSSVTWLVNLPWTMAAGVADFFTGVTDLFVATVQSIANFLMENLHYIAAAIVTTGVLLGVCWAINDAMKKNPEEEHVPRRSRRVCFQVKPYNPVTGK